MPPAGLGKLYGTGLERSKGLMPYQTAALQKLLYERPERQRMPRSDYCLRAQLPG